MNLSLTIWARAWHLEENVYHTITDAMSHEYDYIRPLTPFDNGRSIKQAIEEELLC